jgi:TMEM199 family protein
LFSKPNLRSTIMVLLTMTPSIVEAIHIQKSSDSLLQEKPQLREGEGESEGEPSLEGPRVGNPISHSQIVDLWRVLKAVGRTGFSLEKLLEGSKVYIPPTPPKPKPVSLSNSTRR